MNVPFYFWWIIGMVTLLIPKEDMIMRDRCVASYIRLHTVNMYVQHLLCKLFNHVWAASIKSHL
jgi:hypothetical protein